MFLHERIDVFALLKGVGTADLHGVGDYEAVGVGFAGGFVGSNCSWNGKGVCQGKGGEEEGEEREKRCGELHRKCAALGLTVLWCVDYGTLENRGMLRVRVGGVSDFVE